MTSAGPRSCQEPSGSPALVRGGIWLVLAAGYGAGTSWLPAPSDGSFWIGNASAAYLVLPFLAAASAGRTKAFTVVLGVLVDWTMVAAFYARSLYDPAVLANNRRMGQPAFSIGQLLDWITHLFTLSGRWVALGVLAGITFGWLGHQWRRTGALVLACTLSVNLS
jgi:hypothetical protein